MLSRQRLTSGSARPHAGLQFIQAINPHSTLEKPADGLVWPSVSLIKEFVMKEFEIDRLLAVEFLKRNLNVCNKLQGLMLQIKDNSLVDNAKRINNQRQRMLQRLLKLLMDDSILKLDVEKLLERR